jgi:hypothetical protein
MLGRSILSGIHIEKMLLHGILVIIIITSVPWKSTFQDEFRKECFSIALLIKN